jgi:tetratricopeptide (TPR) repeat protein
VLRLSVASLRAAQAGDWAEAARMLVQAGEVEEAARRLDQAEELYCKALELGRKPRDRTAEGLARRRLGRVLRLKGRLDEAAKQYRRSFEVAEAQRDLEGMVVACQGLGNVFVDQGRWANAQSWYERGLEIVEPTKPSLLHWQLYNNLAVVALRQGNLVESEGWLQQAEAVADSANGEPSRLVAENNLGRLRVRLGDYSGAEALYRDALMRSPTAFNRCRLLVNLAEVLVQQQELTQAVQVAREAETLAIQYQLIQPLVDTYRALGAVAREQADPEGFLFYEQALALCNDYSLPEFELALTHHEYAKMEAQLGNTTSANARLQQALDIYRKLGTDVEVDQALNDLKRLEDR